AAMLGVPPHLGTAVNANAVHRGNCLSDRESRKTGRVATDSIVTVGTICAKGGRHTSDQSPALFVPVPCYLRCAGTTTLKARRRMAQIAGTDSALRKPCCPTSQEPSHVRTSLRGPVHVLLRPAFGAGVGGACLVGGRRGRAATGRKAGTRCNGYWSDGIRFACAAKATTRARSHAQDQGAGQVCRSQPGE